MFSPHDGRPSTSSYPPRVDADQLSTADFIKNFLLPNKPVIITNATKGWKAVEKFLGDDGKPDFDFLLQEFGRQTVPVTTCSTGKVEKMPSSDEYRRNPFTDKYIRDWHLFSDTNDYSWYSIPRYCSNDWVNNRPAVTKEERVRRRLPLLLHGSDTSFHADVFNSYSWSANICGKKTWWMLPEGGEKKLSKSEREIVDVRKDPKFEEAGRLRMPGEIVFVPSEHYHQVHNTGFTISLNHNWINSFNLPRVFRLMLERFEAAKKEVEKLDSGDFDPAKYVEEFLGLDYGINLHLAIKLCKAILNEERPVGEAVGIDELVERCTCLRTDGEICAECEAFNWAKDHEVCTEMLPKLEAELEQLNAKKWS
ncbi:JmjC domain-containing protein 4 isoform X1 [Aphelenchoides fujianensis]|nr:JmjC domain-containing protein 4 isoform X1 [Aphelenchoides fujianensis]